MTVIERINMLSIQEISLITTCIFHSENYPISNKCRKHHGFIYTIKGTETYIFEDKSVVAIPNSIVYLPKGAKYDIILEGNESIVIYIDFELHQPESQTPFCIKFEDDMTVKALFADAEKCWINKKSDYPSLSKSFFYKICSRIIKKSESYINSNGYTKIADSVNYLQTHYTESDFRIEKLYKIAKVSSRYYEKLFYQKFGETPKEYVLKLKIESAKELLLFEKSSIKDVASQLGYSDIYHFGKLFKAKTGYTPGQYRKLNL